MIRIGVTPCFMYPDIDRVVFGHKSLCYLEKDMARYLARPGVMPFLIPDLEDDPLYEYLAQMDGFVLQGGADIAPETYGEIPILDGKWKGDPYRDAYEIKILEYAIFHNKPVFGICRGMQLLNVYFGGSLYQDIQTQLNRSIPHRSAEIYDQLNHEIRITPGSFLHKIYKIEVNRRVNSIHHQGIKEVGEQLETLAWCPDDGMVEAIGWSGAPEAKVFGVEWHPEFHYNSKAPLIDPEKLYTSFLGFCK